MNHFAQCQTTEQVKATFKKLAFTLHPDTGGTNEAFRELVEQYEIAMLRYKGMELLPEYYKVSGNYEYQRVRVIYIGRNCKCYNFRFATGGLLDIGANNHNLIKTIY